MTASAIFVKTPGLSPVKSRLAADLGRAKAEACHRRCARAVAEIACAAAIGPVYWAVAEPEAMDHPLWQDLPRILQPDGGLGQRMQTVHDCLLQRHDRAVLLGADLPQLTTTALRQTHSWLLTTTAAGVMGPARDGGFWLVGNNRRLDALTWLAPDYGHGPVLRQFLAASDPAMAWHLLPEQTDLDQGRDLPAIAEALTALDQPHPAQSSLLHWLTEHTHCRIPSSP